MKAGISGKVCVDVMAGHSEICSNKRLLDKKLSRARRLLPIVGTEIATLIYKHLHPLIYKTTHVEIQRCRLEGQLGHSTFSFKASWRIVSPSATEVTWWYNRDHLTSHDPGPHHSYMIHLLHLVQSTWKEMFFWNVNRAPNGPDSCHVVRTYSAH